MATQIKGLEGITLRLIKEFDVKKIKDMKNSLIGITEDWIISEDEKPELRRILKMLDEMALAISELRLVGEKVLKGDHDGY